ncbi:MAG: hypothetical protein QOF24_2586, partial [Verrucomicrobiota bacterium]
MPALLSNTMTSLDLRNGTTRPRVPIPTIDQIMIEERAAAFAK